MGRLARGVGGISTLPAIRPEGLTPERSDALVAAAIEAIDRVATPVDAQTLLAQVKLAEAAARLAELGQHYEREWVRVRLMAERRFGVLLGPAQTGRPTGKVFDENLSQDEKNARTKARKVAEVPEPVFDAYVTEAQQPSRAGLLRSAEAGVPVKRRKRRRRVTPEQAAHYLPDILPGAVGDGELRELVVQWCHQRELIDGLLAAHAPLVTRFEGDNSTLLAGLDLVIRTATELKEHLL